MVASTPRPSDISKQAASWIFEGLSGAIFKISDTVVNAFLVYDVKRQNLINSILASVSSPLIYKAYSHFLSEALASPVIKRSFAKVINVSYSFL